MSLSRRDLFSVAGKAIIGVGAFSALRYAGANTRSSVPTYLRVKHFGGNIKFWAFDKSRRYRRDQIKQLTRWGYTKLRDNNPLGLSNQGYDMYHARAVAEECLEQGIEYTIVGADRNVGLENLVSADQWAALMARYGKADDARRAIAAIGIGADDPIIRGWLLDSVSYLRGLFPAGVRLQPYNGPELDGAAPWNMYDEDFRDYARSIGFPMPTELSDPEQMNALVAANYESFKGELSALWGTLVMPDACHPYKYSSQWGTIIHYYPWQPERWTPYISEFGVNRFDVNNWAQELQQMPIKMIQDYAFNGHEVVDSTGVRYNILEMFLHEPLDPGFFDLWQRGDTRPLWNPRRFAQLKASMTDGRQAPTPYSAVMMDPAAGPAMQSVIRQLTSESRGASRGGNGYDRGRGSGRWFSQTPSGYFDQRRAA